MEKAKGIAEIVSKEQVSWLMGQPRSNVFSLAVKDSDGNIQAFENGFLVGDRAVSYIAATNGKARKSRAAYLALWETIQEARARGATTLDLGGIDQPRGQRRRVEDIGKIDAEREKCRGKDHAKITVVKTKRLHLQENR